MTHKEIAARLREIPNYDAQALAEELDPPKPAAGTVVWWSHLAEPDTKFLGYVVDGGIRSLGSEKSANEGYFVRWSAITWKLARILGPDEMGPWIPFAADYEPDLQKPFYLSTAGRMEAE